MTQARDTIKLYLEEQQTIQQIRDATPAAMQPVNRLSYPELLETVGITVDFGHLPQGYINFYPQDFIVEEVSPDNRLSTVDYQADEVLEPTGDQRTLYADLVKVGLSSIEAAQGLAEALGLGLEAISYAGIKDKIALTSQRISIRHPDVERLRAAQPPGMFLKNYQWSKGVVEKGHLTGNRFTIVVRTPVTLGAGWLDQAFKKISGGFYNFYHFQRFGTPRLISHVLGKHLLCQDYRGVVETFLCDVGAYETPLLGELRGEAKRSFGNWPLIDNLFSQLPYTMRLERILLGHLIDHPQDFAGALRLISDQTTLWVYAYASYLFNRHLSELAESGQSIPQEIPLLLNPAYKTIPAYIGQLHADGISDLVGSLERLFGRNPMNSKNTAPAKVLAAMLKSQIVDRAVILSFQLPPAVYATTFLSHLFLLERGYPTSDWVTTEKFDAKKILGLGSIEQTEKKLERYFFKQAESL